MNIGTLIVSMGIDASGLNQGMTAMQQFEKSITSSLNTTAQRFRTFGYLATAAITAPMVMAGKASMKMASDFEFSTQKIVGLAGVAQNTVNAWSEEILKMGPEVAKKPQELADALYFIASSGIKGAEALEVLKVSAKAATSGLGSTVEMADLLTSVLNAYAGTGMTAAKAADILVAAVREGKGEADAFARTMGQIIPIAANLGVSFDQVAGGMAAITLTGSSAANSAVYLKGIFNSLLKATSQGEAALNGMNTSYAELRKILKDQGLIPLMQKLRDLQMKYGDEAISDVLPNIRALTGFLSIAGKNFKYNTELMQRVTESSGSLGKAFAAVADTIKVRYDQAISAANVSMISLGKSIAEALLPLLEKLVKELGQLTEWFNSLTEEQKRHKLVLVGIIALLGPLSLLISVIGYTLSGLISTVGMITKVFGLWNAQLIVTRTAGVITNLTLGTLSVTFESLSAVMLSAGAAIGKFVFAGLGIGVVVTAAWPLIQKLIDKIKDLKEQIAEAKAALGYVSPAMELDVSIGKRMSVLKTLSQDQLQILANDIVQRRALEEEKLLIARTYGLKEIEQEEKVLKWKQEIADKEANLAHLKKTEAYDTADVQRWTDATKYYVEERKQLISDYIKDRQYETEVDKNSALVVIKFYDEQGKAVEKLIKKQGGLNDVINAHTQSNKEAVKALEEYNDKLKEQNKELDRIETNRIKGGTPTDYQHLFLRTGAVGGGAMAGNKSAFILELENQLKVIDTLDRAISVKIGENGRDAFNATTKSINVLSNAMEYLFSDNVIKGTDTWIREFKTVLTLLGKYDEDLAKIEKSKMIFENVGQGVTDMAILIGTSIGNVKIVWQDYVNTILSTTQQIITALLAQYVTTLLTASATLAAKEIARKGLFGLVTAAIGIAALMTLMTNSKNAAEASKMAQGGIIPPGYPNDTYPARLTSGEIVIPPGKLSSISSDNGGEVIFHIEGTSLVGVLNKYNKKIKSFA
jgi:TP901 family phage tail tape measure protein